MTQSCLAPVAGRLGTLTGRSMRLLEPRGVGRLALELRAGNIGPLVLAIAANDGELPATRGGRWVRVRAGYWRSTLRVRERAGSRLPPFAYGP